MSTIEVTSPFDGRVVGTVKFSSVEEVQGAIDLAYTTFEDHKNALPKYRRVEILEKLVEIMPRSSFESYQCVIRFLLVLSSAKMRRKTEKKGSTPSVGK